jgi:hypothetical protein
MVRCSPHQGSERVGPVPGSQVSLLLCLLQSGYPLLKRETPEGLRGVLDESLIARGMSITKRVIHAQDQTMREQYLADAEWYEAVPLFAHSFSVLLTPLTSDGHTILVQRGKSLGCRPNVFDVSLAEGLSRPVDRSTTSQAPDVYRCAMRGLAEELAYMRLLISLLQISSFYTFSTSSIRFNSASPASSGSTWQASGGNERTTFCAA